MGGKCTIRSRRLAKGNGFGWMRKPLWWRELPRAKLPANQSEPGRALAGFGWLAYAPSSSPAVGSTSRFQQAMAGRGSTAGGAGGWDLADGDGRDERPAGRSGRSAATAQTGPPRCNSGCPGGVAAKRKNQSRAHFRHT